MHEEKGGKWCAAYLGCLCLALRTLPLLFLEPDREESGVAVVCAAHEKEERKKKCLPGLLVIFQVVMRCG